MLVCFFKRFKEEGHPLDCFCEQESRELKIEGDAGADPLWCNRCGCNLDMEDFPISNELKKELEDWSVKYGQWFNWNTDTLLPNGLELEEEHNKQGKKLTALAQQEIAGKYIVIFSPSLMAKGYTNEY